LNEGHGLLIANLGSACLIRSYVELGKLQGKHTCG
jgi:hypothetical protein